MKAISPIFRYTALGGCAALSLLLGACVGPVQAPVRAPLPPFIEPPLPAPVAAPEWHDMPATPGVWSWRREGIFSVARFGDSLHPALLSLSCDGRTDTITISRGDAEEAATSMMILTTTLSREVGVRSRGDGVVATTLAARDPLLDAMAYSRGRFAVKGAGAAALYLPSWPEVARVIEDCR